MKLIDISPVISNNTAVFPGDTALSFTLKCDYKKGDRFALGALNTTTHIGAHTDAPYHFHEQGETMEARPLEHYYGPCQVIYVQTQNPRIYPQDIAHVDITTERILFKTNSYPDAEQWCDDFTSLSPELIEQLAQSNVKLVGIDTPSIDPPTSKALESHHKVYEHDMAILEGIRLAHVEEGNYTLSALPLNIKGADASPVRAILILG